MKTLAVLSFFTVFSAFAGDLTSAIKSEFEANQKASCVVVSKSASVFSVYCENQNKVGTFTVEVADGVLAGEGTSWLKGTPHQAGCDVEGSVSGNVVTSLNVSCLHSLRP